MEKEMRWGRPRLNRARENQIPWKSGLGRFGRIHRLCLGHAEKKEEGTALWAPSIRERSAGSWSSAAEKREGARAFLGHTLGRNLGRTWGEGSWASSTGLGREQVSFLSFFSFPISFPNEVLSTNKIKLETTSTKIIMFQHECQTCS